jgi:hypothetical protein
MHDNLLVNVFLLFINILLSSRDGLRLSRDRYFAALKMADRGGDSRQTAFAERNF